MEIIIKKLLLALSLFTLASSTKSFECPPSKDDYKTYVVIRDNRLKNHS